MRAKLISTLAATAALAVALVGCSGDADPDPGGSGTPDQDEEYTILWINPASGSGAAFGEASRAGIELALEDIEAAGGINGGKLNVIFEDNELSPDATITAYQRRIGENPVAVMLAGSSTVLALYPFAEQDGIMIANNGAQTPQLISPDYPYVYNFIPTSAAEATRLAERMYADDGIRNVAVLATDNDYGKDTAAAFEEAFKAEGGAVAAHEIHAVGSTDMRTQLTKIRASGADALVIVANVGEVGHSVAQSSELALGLPVYGFTYALSPDNFAVAGDAMNGVKGVAVSFLGGGDIATDFAKRFEDATGVFPNVTAAVSYDTTMILAEGLRQVGNDRAALMDYVSKVKGHEGVLGTTSMMMPERQVIFPLNEFIVVDGEIETW